MSIIDKIMGRTPPAQPAPAAKVDKNAELGPFVAPAFLDSIPPTKKDEDFLKATTTGWVYACANAISIEVASTNLKLMRQTPDGPVELLNHPLLDLLFRVNNFTTAYDHWYRVQMFLEGAGEAPLYLQRSSPKAKPNAMMLLRPDRLSIKFDPKKVIGGYTYRKDNGTEMPIAAEDIVFLRNPSVLSDFRGMGTIQAAAVTVDSEEFAEKHNRNFFYNGARPDFVLETDAKLHQQVIDRLRKLWESLYRGVNNAHKMAILEQGIKAKALGMSPKDMDFIEQLRWSRDKILGIFQVPKSVLGITEDVNRANAEAGYFTFARFTVKPRIERIVQQLNEFLVPQFGDDLFIDYQDPTPDNLEQRAAYMTVAKEWFTVNELRALDNLPPVRGGDTIYRPVGQQPAFSLEKPAVPKEYAPSGRRAKTHAAGSYGRTAAKRKAVEQALVPLAAEILKRQIAGRQHKRKPSVTKSAGKKDLIPYLKTDDERDAFQKFLNIKSIARFEELMAQKAAASFLQQARMVEENFGEQETVKLPKVRGRKKDPGDAEVKRKAEEILKAIWDEDSAALEALMTNNLSPLILEIVREQAFNTANFLSLSVGDITTDPRINQQVQDMAIKLSGDVGNTTREAVRQALLDGIGEGEGVQKISERIKAVFDQASIVRSEIIARSESIRASNYAAEETYRAAGVKFKEWITASDERTCPFCAEMDGKRIEVGTDFWKLGQTMSVEGEDLSFNYLDVQGPPLHPNCRCTLGPVIES